MSPPSDFVILPGVFKTRNLYFLHNKSGCIVIISPPLYVSAPGCVLDCGSSSIMLSSQIDVMCQCYVRVDMLRKLGGGLSLIHCVTLLQLTVAVRSFREGR
jgi:hypothetical protein